MSTPLANELRENFKALEFLERQEFPRPLHTQVLTISNQKGGVGKTTSTVNLAAGLALGGYNVVVIDGDPQGNATTALGIPRQSEAISTYDVMLGEATLRQSLLQCPHIEGIRVCPATIDLAGAEVELVDVRSREYLLREAVERFHETDPDVDVILIDSPPSLGLLTINALVAADQVVIPIQTEYYALEGLSLLLNTIERVKQSLNPQLKLAAILLTMVDGRTKLSAEVISEVRSHFGSLVLETEIPRSVRISEAPSYGETAVSYEPRGTGAVTYRKAAWELSTRLRGADDNA